MRACCIVLYTKATHMTHRVSIWAVIGALALGGVATHADERAPQRQPESASVTLCDGRTGDEARELAEQAEHSDHYRRAAECFRAAGDPLHADHALIQAHADESAANGRRASETLDAAKRQAALLRAAFRKTESARR